MRTKYKYIINDVKEYNMDLPVGSQWTLGHIIERWPKLLNDPTTIHAPMPLKTIENVLNFSYLFMDLKGLTRTLIRSVSLLAVYL